ncbi:MAG: hypothetical protein ACXAEL_12155 [Candidatus Hodarchaeales archaeon]|jgi:5-methyltetrahydropteroyltriglutamate--homocysteine methyltransferase
MAAFDRLFPTHEVGSIRKLNATILALQRKPIARVHLDEIHYWWDRLGVNKPGPDEFIHLLTHPPSSEAEISEWETKILLGRLLFNIRLLESTGLDFVYTGEAFRREMYEHFAKDILGIHLEDHHIRSFDDRFYRPGVRIAGRKAERRQPISIEEFEYAKQVAQKPLRLCLTGPYTVYDWTIKEQGSEEFFFELIKNVYVPEVVDAIRAGAQIISLDEPANTTKPYERELYVEGYKELFQTVGSTARGNNVKLGFHTCYSDNYEQLFEDLPELPWDFGSLEVANRDLKGLGTTNTTRPAFKETLDMMVEVYNSGCRIKLTLGVLEVHADKQFAQDAIQSGRAEKELRSVIRDRVVYMGEYLYNQLGEDGPYYLMIGPDCGLRPVSDFRAVQMMLRAMVDGAADARNSLIDRYGLQEFKQL